MMENKNWPIVDILGFSKSGVLNLLLLAYPQIKIDPPNPFCFSFIGLILIWFIFSRTPPPPNCLRTPKVEF